MRTLQFIVSCAVLALVGCETKDAAAAPKPADTKPSDTKPKPKVGGPPPVEASFVRIDPKREVMIYNVKIKTDRRLHQVDLQFRYLDAKGKEISLGGLAWQNNVKGHVQPIEPGHTYEDADSASPDNTAGCEITVKRVWFDDGSAWTP